MIHLSFQLGLLWELSWNDFISCSSKKKSIKFNEQNQIVRRCVLSIWNWSSCSKVEKIISSFFSLSLLVHNFNSSDRSWRYFKTKLSFKPRHIFDRQWEFFVWSSIAIKYWLICKWQLRWDFFPEKKNSYRRENWWKIHCVREIISNRKVENETRKLKLSRTNTCKWDISSPGQVIQEEQKKASTENHFEFPAEIECLLLLSIIVIILWVSDCQVAPSFSVKVKRIWPSVFVIWMSETLGTFRLLWVWQMPSYSTGNNFCLSQPSNNLNERSHRRVQSISPKFACQNHTSRVQCYDIHLSIELKSEKPLGSGEVKWIEKSRNFPRNSVTFERLLIGCATLSWDVLMFRTRSRPAHYYDYQKQLDADISKTSYLCVNYFQITGNFRRK